MMISKHSYDYFYLKLKQQRWKSMYSYDQRCSYAEFHNGYYFSSAGLLYLQRAGQIQYQESLV